MCWRQIEPVGRLHKEAFLQDVFDNWGRDSTTCNIAGAPRWLTDNKIVPTNSRTSVHAQGYRFTPDAYWSHLNPPRVFELKCAAKYEPQALAEVLHHAALLSWQSKTQVIPTILSSYNAWLRAATQYLFEHDLKRESITYLEADYLAWNNRTILWIDEPLAELTQKERPESIPKWDSEPSGTWYEVVGSNAWILSTSLLGNFRTPFPDSPCTMIARVASATNAPTFVRWEGTPPTRGSSRWLKSEYHVFV